MSQPKKILIADDEPDILEILQFNLEAEGYIVKTAKNGIEAIELSKSFLPELVILDVMMPGKTGIQACEEMRTIPTLANVLIVFLTALSDDISEVKGLEAGADDFISKPIRPKVIISKINSLFRRIQDSASRKNQSYNELFIDREEYKVKYKERDITLARKEFELLSLLASKPGKVFLRNDILLKIWGNEVIVGDRTIDVHIRKIRQKIGVDCITTVKGVGYKFEM
jgi:two-component system alkaline phosphatase synthesis response regulator PhoP